MPISYVSFNVKNPKRYNPGLTVEYLVKSSTNPSHNLWRLVNQTTVKKITVGINFEVMERNSVFGKKVIATSYRSLFFIILLSVFSFSACDDTEVEKEPEKPVVTLSANPLDFTFIADGGVHVISVESNSIWKVSYTPGLWFRTSLQSVKGNAEMDIIVDENLTEDQRTGSITITSEGADDIIVAVTQEGAIIIPEPVVPDNIPPDNTGMNNDAIAIASEIYLGWNLGNTLEAIGGETAWGNPKTTNEIIQAVKSAGFSAIRLPCAWNQYLEDQTTYKIKSFWLDRVQEVVDYCVNNDMYVILNIHWDGGWLENNCTPEKKDEVNAKQGAIWKQIAKRFRDYDEHLLFAGANEPNAENQEQVDVLNVYMQTFVDVVRATGGRNTYRTLIIPGPLTDIDKTDEFMTMPTDPTQNRMMAEVHYYTPWQFCGLEEDASWGKVYYFWGKDYHIEGAEGRYPEWNSEEDYMVDQFQRMKTKFVDQGVPVILGEFGAMRRTITESAEWQDYHEASRAYFYETVARESKNHGLVPFLWDTGHGVIDRNTLGIFDQQDYDGLTKGATDGIYPY
jgi:endoglucanase